MRWVANSGLAYTKVNDIIEDQTWRYANLADDDVLLDGTFTVGFVEFEDGVNEKGGRKRRCKRRNDGIAKWTVEEDPSIGYPPFLCMLFGHSILCVLSFCYSSALLQFLCVVSFFTFQLC